VTGWTKLGGWQRPAALHWLGFVHERRVVGRVTGGGCRGALCHHRIYREQTGASL